MATQDRGEGMRRFARPKCSREPMREFQNIKSRVPPQSRTGVPRIKTCRFYSMPSGCVRGENCSYTHEGGDSRKEKRGALVKIKRILVSGLPPFVDSEELYSFFEHRFGSLLDATIIPHADEQTAGRFGILSFKSEEALFSAIQSNNVYIFGQKVNMEVVYGRAAKDFMADPEDLPCKRLFGDDEPFVAKLAPPIKSLVNCPNLPVWAQKFRDWLPNFLDEVFRRTGDGESYPLCSLKGDFRATCGLEIDHVALGFEKLSDFIRAWPEICKPKIVPVGGGPATHIVLDRVSGTPADSLTVPDSDSFSQLKLSEPEEYSLFRHNIQHAMSTTEDGDSGDTTGACMSCLRQEALWLAYPCGHRALCTSCKEKQEESEPWSASCSLCQQCIEGWAAVP